MIKELRTHNIEVLLKLFKRLTDNLHLANLGDGVKWWPRVVVRVLFRHHLEIKKNIFFCLLLSGQCSMSTHLTLVPAA